MWAAVRGIVVWVFGDDLVKYALYVVGGLLLLVYVEASAATTAIMGQPWGQWWLAGVSGGIQSDKSSHGTTASGSVAVVVPTLIPQPVLALDSATTVITSAMAWLGVRYLWGGCTHAGVDCSCFMQNVFATVGIHLPRVTVDQIRFATAISADQAVAGDLVFFDNTCTGCGANPTHVGLYLGGGRMIDAGDPVQIERVFGGHNARFGRVLR